MVNVYTQMKERQKAEFLYGLGMNDPRIAAILGKTRQTIFAWRHGAIEANRVWRTFPQGVSYDLVEMMVERNLDLLER